jgi:hypothetical protein
LLEAQLLDQQLYFEKMLARETVRALELSYQHHQQQHQQPHQQQHQQPHHHQQQQMLKKSVNTSQDHKVGAFNSGDVGSISSAEREYPGGTRGASASTTSASVGGAGSSLLESEDYLNAHSEVHDDAMLHAMETVAAVKLEISLLEQEYCGVLAAIKQVDLATREAKKSNDQIINRIKAQVRFA